MLRKIKLKLKLKLGTEVYHIDSANAASPYNQIELSRFWGHKLYDFKSISLMNFQILRLQKHPHPT
jgi:hypothetical protein